MAFCINCGSQIGVLGGLLGKTTRCRKCENTRSQSLINFRQTFISYSSDGILSAPKWQYLQDCAKRENLGWNEALQYVRGDSLQLLERALAMASSDGVITDEEFGYIGQLRETLAIPHEMAQSLLQRLHYLKYISDIRQGKLPIIKSSVHLESDEHCYLETEAIYHKVNAQSVKNISGRLLATDKKLHFLSQAGGGTIQWKNIMRIERDARSVYIELSTKLGNGRYSVTDPVLTEAILETVARIHKRQLISTQGTPENRHIPQDVKIAVWQRDHGRCVQCQAQSYLEYDHIIPHSKGGANTVNNIQLLCRKCNLGKSDRI